MPQEEDRIILSCPERVDLSNRDFFRIKYRVILEIEPTELHVTWREYWEIVDRIVSDTVLCSHIADYWIARFETQKQNRNPAPSPRDFHNDFVSKCDPDDRVRGEMISTFISEKIEASALANSIDAGKLALASRFIVNRYSETHNDYICNH